MIRVMRSKEEKADLVKQVKEKVEHGKSFNEACAELGIAYWQYKAYLNQLGGKKKVQAKPDKPKRAYKRKPILVNVPIGEDWSHEHKGLDKAVILELIRKLASLL